jgi:23S rRNA (uracil1939-C5)-methyltransferase
MDMPILLREGCETLCPGCAHRTKSAQESRTQKENWLRSQLLPWQDRFIPIQAVTERARWGYRDKLRLSTAWNETGWQFGLVVRDELISIPRCPVHSEEARKTIQWLSRVLPPGPVFPMAFYVQSGAQITLVLKTSRMPDLGWLDSALRQEDLTEIGIEGLWLHLHPAAGRRLFAKKGWHLLWGQPRSLNGNGLQYGPSAFQQVIPVLYQRALDEAEEFLTPSRNRPVVDLYCGIGASLVRWINRGASTVAVELGGEAVECARRNAPQALILRGKCKDRIPQIRTWLAANGREAGQCLLYVNPPRTGIEPEVLEWIISDFRPLRMAYLSCSVGTLRRDLDSLANAHYQVDRVTPYDFFPQTYHVETLVLLQRMIKRTGC